MTQSRSQAAIPVAVELWEQGRRHDVVSVAQEAVALLEMELRKQVVDTPS